jgi:hypothetical protein
VKSTFIFFLVTLLSLFQTHRNLYIDSYFAYLFLIPKLYVLNFSALAGM